MTPIRPVLPAARVALRAGALAAVAAFLFGCSESSGPLPTPPANPAAGIRVGTRAHEISGEDLLGQPMKLSDYRGQVVLLDFWGNW